MRGIEDLRKLRIHRIARTPYLDGINIGSNNIFQVRCQGCAIGSWSAPRQANSLCDIENNTCEAILVEVDFLVVWYLANGTCIVSREGGKGSKGQGARVTIPDVGEGGGEVDDKSAAEEGRAAEGGHVEQLNS